MIHYALRCGAGHDFDGWFKSSASFDTQSEQGLLDCPVCADTAVRRAIMSPRLARGAQATPSAVPASEPASIPAAATTLPMPDQVRAALQRIRVEVEKNCDYVGPKFADTARRIHAGAEPHRAIYGEATPDEAAGLADDGIEVSRIPWVPRADS